MDKNNYKNKPFSQIVEQFTGDGASLKAFGKEVRWKLDKSQVGSWGGIYDYDAIEDIFYAVKDSSYTFSLDFSDFNYTDILPYGEYMMDYLLYDPDLYSYTSLDYKLTKLALPSGICRYWEKQFCFFQNLTSLIFPDEGGAVWKADYYLTFDTSNPELVASWFKYNPLNPHNSGAYASSNVQCFWE